MTSGIMIDIDGVLADFVHGFSMLANELYGLPVLKYWQVTDWSFEKSGYCAREQEDELWHKIRASDSFWSSLPLLKNVSDRALQLVREHHHRQPLIFVTSRPGVNAWEQTTAWLTAWGISHPLVIMADNHREHMSKVEICRIHGLVSAIEDSPYELERLYKAGGVETVKIEYPYNRGARSWRTASTLSEALDKLDVGIDDEV